MSIPERLAFRKLQIADIPLMVEWLNAAHVKRWWRDHTNEPLTYSDVMRDYLPAITGQVPTQKYLILYVDKPIGYIQTYLIQSYPDYAHYVDAGEIAAGIDMFIGDVPIIKLGLAAPAVQKFLREVVFTRLDVASCITGPAISNERAIHDYEKAGFRYLKTITQPNKAEPAYLMRIGRYEATVGSFPNLASWYSVSQMYEEMRTIQGREAFNPVADLVERIVTSPRARLFRGGSQLSTLIISTKDRWGLEMDDYSIELHPVYNTDDYEFSYIGKAQMLEQRICKQHELRSILDDLLRRLWIDTKPDDPLPDTLDW